jgi:hypothetical protein
MFCDPGIIPTKCMLIYCRGLLVNIILILDVYENSTNKITLKNVNVL